ncbi:hypothetical protein CGRA01v4_12618 [Colletotrichum graminicola]|uniref:Uncharacterized protein n=1 Tax=Colletotrichum graminicola (strain M1.001 / M2 / FGSC 10212) TaxID=645133 RepID=E3QIJ3_COLGM|nr:uncharacterized protein GLRG_05747 [Colletotrichum graminicola M1.001]EFQ30603.1 hypothetical protein GLRG_05747 [Colletotrichum graminicola M1.001]WDK21328.1 hypothetical protein CGRA01v4_12618 [Colletotrichum graminicola]
MGLLKFFSSKKSPNKPQNEIKVQAYDATTASLPPLLGTYPVAGNGPTAVFEGLQRSHYKMSETNLSFMTDFDIAAPAPPVPRFRDTSAQRPSSAPGGDWRNPSPSSKPARNSSRGPPLSFRKPRIGSLSSTNSGFSPTPKQRADLSAVPFEGDPFLPPPAPFSHSRHMSMRSTGTAARGFVDLLDAQSEIRPSGFQSRVKASGARDYGEDVADRNIGENGVDLASERVQEFYAANTNLRPQTTGTCVRDKRETFVNPGRRESTVNENRTKSLTTSIGQVSFRSNILNPESSLSRQPIMESVAGSGSVRRRQSLGAYIPTAPVSFVSSFVPAGPLNSHPMTFGAIAPQIAARQQKRRSTLGGEAPLDTMSILSTSVGGQAESSLSPKTSQKPPYLVKHNYSLPVQQRPKTSGHSYVESFQSMRPSSRGGSVASSTFSSPTQKNSSSKRHTLFARGPTARHTEWPRNAKLDEPIDTRGWVSRVEIESFENSADVALSAPSPHVMRSGRLWLEEQEDSCQSPKAPLSPHGIGTQEETLEHFSMRKSSLRQWSMSSSSPTTSSTSSFQRTHSRRTTTTSIDLATKSSLRNDSQTSLHSETGDFAAYCAALENALSAPMDLANPETSFNMDDYLSSEDDVDADSFITTRERESVHIGGNEEELLFSVEGYGEQGFQLPGLFDTISKIPDSSATSLEHSNKRFTLSNPSWFARRASLDSWAEAPISPVKEEKGKEDDDSLFDIPIRSDLALGPRGTRRISALGTMYQSTYANREEDKADVWMAVRMRKEAKARQRVVVRTSKSLQRLA